MVIMQLLPNYFWKKQLVSLLVYHFVTSLILVAPVLIPFFTEWGNLNMAQILTLQSIYLIVSLLAEIPTGVVADKFGRKISVIFGNLTYILGGFLYSAVSSFPVFAVAETLMGIGRAFNSGAAEALEYESLKELNLKEKYLQFVYKKRTAQLLGNIFAGLLAFLLVKVIFVRYFMAIYAVFQMVGVVILMLFVKEPKEKEEKEFVPKYREIINTALKNLKKESLLLKFTLASVGIFVASYSQFWLYQKILLKAKIDYSYFGLFSIIIYLLGIGWSSVFPSWYKKFGLKRILILVLLVGIAFQASFLMVKAPLFLAPVLIFLVALWRESTFLPTKAINDLIQSEVRSTVLSFISLFRSLVIALLNPGVGFLADKNIYLTLLLTSGVGLILVLFSLGSYSQQVSRKNEG